MNKIFEEKLISDLCPDPDKQSTIKNRLNKLSDNYEANILIFGEDGKRDLNGLTKTEIKERRQQLADIVETVISIAHAPEHGQTLLQLNSLDISTPPPPLIGAYQQLSSAHDDLIDALRKYDDFLEGIGKRHIPSVIPYVALLISLFELQFLINGKLLPKDANVNWCQQILMAIIGKQINAKTIEHHITAFRKSNNFSK